MPSAAAADAGDGGDEKNSMSAPRVFEINTVFAIDEVTKKVAPDRNFPNNKVMTTSYTKWNFIPKNLFQ